MSDTMYELLISDLYVKLAGEYGTVTEVDAPGKTSGTVTVKCKVGGGTMTFSAVFTEDEDNVV